MISPFKGALVAGLAAVLAACGGGSPASVSNTSTTSTPVVTATRAPMYEVAAFAGSLQVLTEPHGAPKVRLPQINKAGAHTVLLVKQRKGDWTEVYLPTRPNGSTGWVENRFLTLHGTDAHIRVTLKQNLIQVFDGAKVVVRGTVAIGKPSTPTPTGTFFVTENVRPTPPGGAYGDVALGLSAHSDALLTFAGGDGQVAIHGTNAPSSIGKDVSHGCVRVTNDVASYLKQVPTGTPVQIVP